MVTRAVCRAMRTEVLKEHKSASVLYANHRGSAYCIARPCYLSRSVREIGQRYESSMFT